MGVAGRTESDGETPASEGLGPDSGRGARQDMWWFSGVQRDVLLYAKPAAVLPLPSCLTAPPCFPRLLLVNARSTPPPPPSY